MRIDIGYTNEILAKLNEDDLVSAMVLIKLNANRIGRSLKDIAQTEKDNQYRKVPRDACRVCILALCSKFNRLLSEGNENPEDYMKAILTIYSGLEILEKNDIHRNQSVRNLKISLKYG